MTPRVQEDESLARRVRSGALWGGVNVALSRLLQLATTIVVARLVAPEHFGALAIALAVSTIAMNASELGTTASIARAHRDAAPIAPTVYTIALVTSGLLTAAMWFGAPALGSVMGDPGAAPVIQVMSLTVALAGVCSVPSSLVWREFQQGRRMVVDLTSIAVTTALVIPFALAGWGAMALAWSRVGGALAAAVLYLWLAPTRYRPGLSVAELPGLLRSGTPLALANIVVFATLNLDYVVVGRQLGPRHLGIYMLAFNLASLPSTVLTQIVRTVAVPAFGRLHAQGRLGAVVPDALRGVSLATFPVAALLTALAVPLMRAVYGQAYGAGASALAWLGVFAAGRVLTELLADLSLGAGRTGSLLWVQVVWALALLPVLVVAVPAVGIAGAGLAHSIVVWVVVAPLYLVILRRVCGSSPLAVGSAILPAAVGSVAGGVVAWAVSATVPGVLWQIGLGGVAGLVVYVVVTAPWTVPLAVRIRPLLRPRAAVRTEALAQ